MLELTLVRHASTRLNETSRYQGSTDEPLGARGRSEARRLGGRLRMESFDLVVASDLDRCTETLSIALPSRSPRLDPRLREIDFGAWEGRSWEECEAMDPERMAAWMARPEETTPPDGERFEHFAARLDEAVNTLPPMGSALIVTHGGPIRWIVARALGLAWRQAACMEISACGIVRLALHPEGGHLRCWNDTAHLNLPHTTDE